ncbi:MAG TPA: YcnI family protein [Acidimicrobiales bacterium]
MRPHRRLIVLGAGATGLLLATATTASAHVNADPAEAPAGGTTVIEFSTSHGCDGSPTTKLAIQIPEGVTSVRPTVVADWSIEISTEQLDQPIDDGHGGQITERVATVTYTATGEPLADGLRQVFPVSMKLPDTPGEKLVFPVVQTCVDGENAWISVPEDGAEEPENPAPVVALVQGTGDDGHGSTDGAAATEDGEEAAPATNGSDDDGDDSDGTALATAALVVGGLGLAVGGLSLARTRR